MNRVDLHSHSTASDGIKSPRELIALAQDESLSVFSLTDHDTLDGILESVDAAKDLKMEFIPGIELSVDLEENGLSAHLLGYFPDADIPDLVNPATSLGEAITFVQHGRSRRNPRIIEKLANNGIYIDMKAAEDIARGDVLGRPHIAEAMLNAGYVSNIREAFNRYLAKGKSAYVDRDRLSVFRAIETITASGGLPVIAHPGYIEMGQEGLRSLFRRMKECGLIGIEVYYPSHTESMIETLKSFAGELHLAVTGGTDYHGRSDEAAPLGGAEDGFHVDLKNIKEFITICRDHSRR